MASKRKGAPWLCHCSSNPEESCKKETWQSASKVDTFSARISFVSDGRAGVEGGQGYEWVQTAIQPTIFPPMFLIHARQTV